MRLIDADVLQSEYKKYHDGKRSILIDVAPAIEPPTTTWLGSYSPYQCEHCGFHVDSKERGIREKERKKSMSKCKPVYLVCHYEPDDGAIFGPTEITIAYHEIESDALNEKIANLIKDFEKKYMGEE